MGSNAKETMTKQELIDRYIDSVGSTRVQGETAEPILPFLLGDAIYTIYSRDIAPLSLPHRENIIRRHWADNYNMFNRPFFHAIGVSNYEQLTDIMDDFESYIELNMMQLRSEMMLLFQEIPFERRGIIVSALLCHILAQAAQCAWGNVYRHRRVVCMVKGRELTIDCPSKNRHLDAINNDAFRLANIWHDDMCKALYDPNKTKGIPLALKALCRRIYGWVINDMEQSTEE